MKQKITLTENDIRKIIKETLTDYFDSENGEFNDYDTPTEKYRVVYHINKQISFTAYRFDEKYVTVARGVEEFDSKEEAYEFFENLKNEYNDCYALTLRIEQGIDTLTGLSWDMVRDASGWLDGRGVRESKLRNFIRESVAQYLNEVMSTDFTEYEHLLPKLKEEYKQLCKKWENICERITQQYHKMGATVDWDRYYPSNLREYIEENGSKEICICLYSPYSPYASYIKDTH